MQPQTKGHVAPTPGPWRVNTWPGVVNPCVVDAQNNAVASIVGRHRDIAVKLANARLIAAAPELLAACLAVHAILLKGTVNTPDYEWEDMAGDVMRAVARARGEAVL